MKNKANPFRNPVKRSLDKLYKPSRIEHKAAEKKQAMELLEMREEASIDAAMELVGAFKEGYKAYQNRNTYDPTETEDWKSGYERAIEDELNKIFQ